MSDKSRCAIIKLYSYDGTFPATINSANQWKDRSKIQTLGPYAQLLFCSVRFPPKTNINLQDKLTTFKGFENRVILYRGLGMTREAIQEYYNMFPKDGLK